MDNFAKRLKAKTSSTRDRELQAAHNWEAREAENFRGNLDKWLNDLKSHAENYARLFAHTDFKYTLDLSRPSTYLVGPSTLKRTGRILAQRLKSEGFRNVHYRTETGMGASAPTLAPSAPRKSPYLTFTFSLPPD